MLRTFVSPAGDHGRDPIFAQARLLLVVSSLICFAALAGIYSRPAGFLAAFWPANAIFAVLLVRMPRRFRPTLVVGALCGYQAAGFATGDMAWLSLQLTATNMVSAGTFAFVYLSVGDREAGFTRARAVVSLACASVIAAAAAGVAGGSFWAHLSGTTYFDAWRVWFSSELMNYLVLLPGLMAMQWPVPLPRIEQVRRFLTGPLILPILAVIATIIISLLATHPVAIVFPVPALIWVALTLPLSTTCLLVLLYSGVMMFAVKLNVYDFGFGGLSEDLMASVHLGVAMIALAPVLVATYNAEKRRQFSELEHAARFDMLTEALNRGAFVQEAEALMQTLSAQRRPVAAVLVDVDHFKRVNDLHGHAAGDLALIALSAAIRKSIRQNDLFGRLGGEEFVLLLPGANASEALLVAERLRSYVERMQTTLANGDILNLTVSVGLSNSPDASADLAEMLLFADRAMYEAKRAGRNQVQVQDVPV